MNTTIPSMGMLALTLLAAEVPGVPAQPITASTGEPELIETGGAGVSLAMTEEGYQKLAAKLVQMPAFVPMTKKPNGISAQARFGVNFVLEDKNRTWALDGDDQTGYVLYADLNANGDLGDDAPLRFELKDGKYSYRFSANAKADPESGLETYPVTFKLVVDRLPSPGQPEGKTALFSYDATVRRGSLAVGTSPMLFQVTGSGGTYDAGHDSIMFDLNGDGTLDPTAERYLLSEKYVNLGDVTYEFTVDRYGRSVTLTPAAEHRPGRAILLAGYPAPDFSFTTLEGKPAKLSDYRGKVTLIDFWGTWCGPCVAAAPELVAAYDRFHARGFEIVGVDVDDTKERLQTFVNNKKLAWPQALDGPSGPIVSLYRVTGFPSYFLLGTDGKIVVAAAPGAPLDLDVELGKLLK